MITWGRPHTDKTDDSDRCSSSPLQFGNIWSWDRQILVTFQNQMHHRAVTTLQTEYRHSDRQTDASLYSSNVLVFSPMCRGVYTPRCGHESWFSPHQKLTWKIVNRCPSDAKPGGLARVLWSTESGCLVLRLFVQFSRFPEHHVMRWIFFKFKFT